MPDNNNIDFSEITKDDIIKAFSEYNRLEKEGQINPMREAKSYLLFYSSKEYSHKYIVGIAYGLKYDKVILDGNLYQSTGSGKNSAGWCMEKNGFILYADKKFKDYLEKNYTNQNTINTYHADLKKAIKICQNIGRLKDKNLNEIMEILRNGDISFEEYDISQKELGFDDKNLFSTLKSKAKAYLEAIKGDKMDTVQENLKKVIEIFCDKWDNGDELWRQKNLNELSGTYRNLKINISFGIGVRISLPKYPYMNFLLEPYITNKGIYPYISYNYENKSFEIGLGVSRDNRPDVSKEIIKNIDDYPPKYISSLNIEEAINVLDIAIDDFYKIIKNKYSTVTIQPLNQILYGPPGTGKTYHTINKAIEIIENRSVGENEDRIELKKQFEKYRQNGQIEFVTFHQSYGYEEFVEGIKAISPDDERNPTDDLIYKVEDGVFKNISNNAKPIKAQPNKLSFDWSNGNIFKMSLGGKNDSEILDWCLENDYISMGWGDEIDFAQISAQNWEDFRDKTISSFADKKLDRFAIQAMYIFKESMKKNDLVFVSFGNLKIVAIGQIVGGYEFKDSIDEIKYSQFRKVKWLFVDKSGILAEKLLLRKLSQQTIYNLDKSYVNRDFLYSLFGENKEIKNKNCVLIIDEINRGNISKIFGELITLIEESKRTGNKEAVEITLPYSGEKFSVPRNLYILGTMNTADRSIALMDTALRRRFHFEEMMPDLRVLEQIDDIEGINVKSLLETINQRIEYLYNRDHTIGHAYFIGLKDIDEDKRKAELDNIFRNKIIPLLQEYFYDDWEKIQMVLGSGFIEKEELKSDVFDEEFRNNEYIEDEKNRYKIAKIFNYTKLSK